jgi:hypothetical protein
MKTGRKEVSIPIKLRGFNYEETYSQKTKKEMAKRTL